MLYPLIKVNTVVRKRVFNTFIISLSCLCFLWYVLSGLELQFESDILVRNAEMVEKDDEAIKVEHINQDNKIYLEDTTSVEGSQVKQYVHVPQKEGTYFIKDKKYMSVELTKDESRDMGTKFFILDWAVFFILLLLRRQYKESKIVRILFFVIFWVFSTFSLVVISYWFKYILKSDIDPAIVIVSRFFITSITMSGINAWKHVQKRKIF